MSEEPEESKDSIPDEDLEQFKRAYRLTLNSMALFVREAQANQTKMAKSKTKPKLDYYTKKFKKNREKFQDELKRLIQLEHILKTNGVDVSKIEAEDLPSAEEQLQQMENPQ